MIYFDHPLFNLLQKEKSIFQLSFESESTCALLTPTCMAVQQGADLLWESRRGNAGEERGREANIKVSVPAGQALLMTAHSVIYTVCSYRQRTIPSAGDIYIHFLKNFLDKYVKYSK